MESITELVKKYVTDALLDQEVWFWEIEKGIPRRQYGRIKHINTSNRRVLIETPRGSGRHSIHCDDVHPLNEEPVVDTTLRK